MRRKIPIKISDGDKKAVAAPLPRTEFPGLAAREPFSVLDFMQP
jgi:hypothetical protein